MLTMIALIVIQPTARRMPRGIRDRHRSGHEQLEDRFGPGAARAIVNMVKATGGELVTKADVTAEIKKNTVVLMTWALAIAGLATTIIIRDNDAKADAIIQQNDAKADAIAQQIRDTKDTVAHLREDMRVLSQDVRALSVGRRSNEPDD